MENSKILRKAKKPKTEALKKNPEPKMVGVLFWMVLSLVLIDDAFDIFVTLTGFLGIVSSVSNWIISGIVFLYMYFEGVKMDSRKIVAWGVGFIVESIPYVGSIIPTYAIIFVLTRVWENNAELIKKISPSILREKIMGVAKK